MITLSQTIALRSFVHWFSHEQWNHVTLQMHFRRNVHPDSDSGSWVHEDMHWWPSCAHKWGFGRSFREIRKCLNVSQKGKNCGKCQKSWMLDHWRWHTVTTWKVATTRNIATPNTEKQLQQFMGMINCYHDNGQDNHTHWPCKQLSWKGTLLGNGKIWDRSHLTLQNVWHALTLMMAMMLKKRTIKSIHFTIMAKSLAFCGEKLNAAQQNCANDGCRKGVIIHSGDNKGLQKNPFQSLSWSWSVHRLQTRNKSPPMKQSVPWRSFRNSKQTRRLFLLPCDTLWNNLIPQQNGKLNSAKGIHFSIATVFDKAFVFLLALEHWKTTGMDGWTWTNHLKIASVCHPSKDTATQLFQILSHPSQTSMVTQAVMVTIGWTEDGPKQAFSDSMSCAK